MVAGALTCGGYSRVAGALMCGRGSHMWGGGESRTANIHSN